MLYFYAEKFDISHDAGYNLEIFSAHKISHFTQYNRVCYVINQNIVLSLSPKYIWVPLFVLDIPSVWTDFHWFCYAVNQVCNQVINCYAIQVILVFNLTTNNFYLPQNSSLVKPRFVETKSVAGSRTYFHNLVLKFLEFENIT